MAKFLIGQRVRIVWVNRAVNSGKVGLETHVVEINDRVGDWTLYGLSGSPIHMEVEDGRMVWYGWSEDQLEPIIPGGAKPSTYSFQELMDKCRERVLV